MKNSKLRITAMLVLALVSAGAWAQDCQRATRNYEVSRNSLRPDRAMVERAWQEMQYACGAASAQPQRAAPACYYTTILKPTPFLGTAEEIIQFDDGSIWQDMSYQYLYLYEYNPQVVLCPARGQMILKNGSRDYVFQLRQLR